MLTCAFTGHRPKKASFLSDPTCDEYRALAKRLDYEMAKSYVEGFRRYISGMALGFDTLAAYRVLALKKIRDDVILEAAVPFFGQESKWSDDNKRVYAELLSQCDKITFVSESYSERVMQKRNEYMVDNAQLLIAAFDGSGGGTGNTVKYALKKGVRVVNVWNEERQLGIEDVV